MDGLTLLAEASAAGLTVTAAGDRLIVRGPRRAEAIAKRLLENKAHVLAALQYAEDLNFDPLPDDLPDEWRERFEERAAIMEHDGGLHPERAEAAAMTYILDAMRRAGVAIPRWNLRKIP